MVFQRRKHKEEKKKCVLEKEIKMNSSSKTATKLQTLNARYEEILKEQEKLLESAKSENEEYEKLEDEVENAKAICIEVNAELKRLNKEFAEVEEKTSTDDDEKSSSTKEELLLELE